MSVSDPKASSLPAKLKLDKKFQPCPTKAGDEIYPNGIFHFNISELLAFVAANPKQFPIETVLLADIPKYSDSPNLDEETVRTADLSRPIVLAEIAPTLFNVIDGNHRLARARRENARTIPAYRVRCPDHIPFLTSTFAYEKYVEYWNSKVKSLRAYAAYG